MRRPIKITRRQALVETGTPEALDPREDTTAPHPLKLDAYARFDDVEEQVSLISTALGSPSDLAVRRISDGIVCLFLSPLVDQGAVRHSLVEPLSRAGWLELQEKGEAARVLPAAGLSEARSIEAAVDKVAEGEAALIVHGRPTPYTLDLRGRVGRQVSPPISEPSVRGPRDSFTENLFDNLSLVRQRIRSRDLRVRELTVGLDTRTRVAVCYLEGRSSPEVVDAVIQRLSAVTAAAVIDSSYLVPYLSKRTWSLFPPAAATERADRACAAIVQGRIVVICDNSPFALVIPIHLVTLFQANEDHYNLAIHSFLLRSVRVIGWLAATLAPALYIGIASFNPGILPAHAVMTIASARQGVPYPPVIEVLIMDIALEMLAEATVRLPTYVGGAATVVGGLILGTAAAQAKLVSNVMIIVVALTAIGSFAIPDYQNQLSWRTVRYLFTFSAAILGIFGVSTAGLIILTHTCSIDVLGESFMSPIAPWRWTSMAKDVPMRVPEPLAVRLTQRQREEEAEGTADA
jgi:hypothetical protein